MPGIYIYGNAQFGILPEVTQHWIGEALLPVSMQRWWRTDREIMRERSRAQIHTLGGFVAEFLPWERQDSGKWEARTQKSMEREKLRVANTGGEILGPLLVRAFLAAVSHITKHKHSTRNQTRERKRENQTMTIIRAA